MNLMSAKTLELLNINKGGEKTKLFFESSERSIRYLKDFLGHDDLAAIEISDAGRLRDYLFDRDMSSSSMKRVFSSVHAVINLAIREQGLPINNVFSGTFISDHEAKTQRSPIPTYEMITIQQECMQSDDEPRSKETVTYTTVHGSCNWENGALENIRTSDLCLRMKVVGKTFILVQYFI